jgi:hypothetical protein
VNGQADTDTVNFEGVLNLTDNLAATAEAINFNNAADVTTTGTVLLDADGGAVVFQSAASLVTTNNTAAAVTIRDASSVILGNISAVNGTLVIGVGQDVTGPVTQVAGTAINILNLTASTASTITLDSTTNRIVTVGAIQSGGDIVIDDSTGGLARSPATAPRG